MSPARSRVPLERDAKGDRILTHGLSGYARGCGCDECTAAHAADMAERRGPARRGPLPGEEKLTVEIHFRVTAATAVELDARIEGKGSRNTTARDILLSALEARQQDKQQRREGQQS